MESPYNSISWFLENMVSPLMIWNHEMEISVKYPNADSISQYHIVIWYRMAKHLLKRQPKA
ncbi:hypothetical protein H5410_006593 [Solanum commersonii]|uniref:Uncharacterized protein n=1 Tax=Solanum commersonii TaxID=4109 RepID=A0A9J6ABT4_SOLCO|nr:hypothetical protein H5410_006593 [Solanum commersonii]